MVRGALPGNLVGFLQRFQDGYRLPGGGDVRHPADDRSELAGVVQRRGVEDATEPDDLALLSVRREPASQSVRRLMVERRTPGVGGDRQDGLDAETAGHDRLRNGLVQLGCGPSGNDGSRVRVPASGADDRRDQHDEE